MTIGTSADLEVLDPIGASWVELGPRPFFGLNPVTQRPDETMSGQVSAIAVDLKHDPTGNLVYVGTSSGGLWKSTNGLSPAPFFVSLSDQARPLSVGSIALDVRTQPATLFVGTGAPDNSANISSYTGAGILTSSDDGQTWKVIQGADSGAHPFFGQGFSSILVDPVNPDVVLASTGIGTDPNHPHSSVPQGDLAFQHLGIYRSEDAGSTWTRVMSADYDGSEFGASAVSPGGFFHIDLLYEGTQDVYFAGISKQGLFRSTDRGVTWNSLQDLGLGSGLPNAGQTYRVSLATRAGMIWALILEVPFATSGAFRLFQSGDGGRSWIEIQLPTLAFKGFLMYVAAPPNSNTLLVAAENLYRRDNIEDPNSPWVSIENNLHGDQHAIAFAGPDSWYAGDDGGAWATSNRGNSWNSLNESLRTLEFFSAAATAEDSGPYGGGMQDNGPALTTGGPAWTQIAFGDGGYVLADPHDSEAFFMSEPFGDIFHVTISTPNTPKKVIRFRDLNIPCDFLTPYEILPTDQSLFSGVSGFAGFDFERSRILLTGANNPWLVAFDPDAPSNNVASVALTDKINSVIHYVAQVPGDPTIAFLTAGSALYRLNNISFSGNATVTQITGGPVNGDVLGHLAVSSAGVLYVIKVGFLGDQKVFSSTDGGNSWLNISGNLPNVPLNWVTVDPVHPNFVFVAGNTGVFVATDGGLDGEPWRRLGSGLPNVPVVQTQISTTRNLIAATFGRGVWTLDISNLQILLSAEGRVTLLRVHDAGTGYGPPTDFLDVDVVTQLDSQPGKAFGFQLRSDENEVAHRGMLDLLRTAFSSGGRVRIDYFRTGLRNGRILRVTDLF
jgi:photosystem II stability/assembly factor-like uncharacterized protein